MRDDLYAYGRWTLSSSLSNEVILPYLSSLTQYDFVETTKKAATTAVEKVKEQTKKTEV